MLPFEDRYSRQRRLPEIGPEGQARLLGAVARVHPHAGADVEWEYLERAGLQVEAAVGQAAPASFPLQEHFEHSAALHVGRGAYAALEQLRSALLAEPRSGGQS